MKLEDQVVSPELSNRMEELGFPQESLCYWCEWMGRDDTLEVVLDYDTDYVVKTGGSFNRYAAYTVAELGEMLKGCDHPVPYWCSQAGVKSWCMFRDGEAYNINEKNEADARAQTLIYLKENNLL